MPKYYNADEVDAVLEKLEDDYGGTSFIAGIYTAHNCIRKVPTADVAPVVHAHWIDSPNIMECVVCSNCFSDDLSAQVVAPPPADYKFCPSCGARMDEEEKQ